MAYPSMLLPGFFIHTRAKIEAWCLEHNRMTSSRKPMDCRRIRLWLDIAFFRRSLPLISDKTQSKNKSEWTISFGNRDLLSWRNSKVSCLMRSAGMMIPAITRTGCTLEVRDGSVPVQPDSSMYITYTCQAPRKSNYGRSRGRRHLSPDIKSVRREG